MARVFATFAALQVMCLIPGAVAWAPQGATPTRPGVPRAAAETEVVSDFSFGGPVLKPVTRLAAESSRREAFTASFSAALAVVAAPVLAEDVSDGAAAESYPEIAVSRDKMGGLLEPYLDVGKGWRVMKPYGWNQFEQKPGEYEAKWTDIVASNKQELVVVTTPVKSTTASIAALGEVGAVATKLAEARAGQVVSAKAALKDGVLFYMFEFSVGDMRQVLQLCVSKGKLWSVTGSAPDKRWSKTGELLNKALLSFMPKL